MKNQFYFFHSANLNSLEQAKCDYYHIRTAFLKQHNDMNDNLKILSTTLSPFTLGF